MHWNYLALGHFWYIIYIPLFCLLYNCVYFKHFCSQLSYLCDQFSFTFYFMSLNFWNLSKAVKHPPSQLCMFLIGWCPSHNVFLGFCFAVLFSFCSRLRYTKGRQKCILAQACSSVWIHPYFPCGNSGRCYIYVLYYRDPLLICIVGILDGY